MVYWFTRSVHSKSFGEYNSYHNTGVLGSGMDISELGSHGISTSSRCFGRKGRRYLEKWRSTTVLGLGIGVVLGRNRIGVMATGLMVIS